MANVKAIVGETISFAHNPYDALENADALIIATEWNEFRTPDFQKLGSLLKQKAIFDGRNLFDLNQMRQMDFYYYSIGRATIIPN
jgi:UDPglucose 6-dehydrogenase